MIYLCFFTIVLIGSANCMNATGERRDFTGYPSHQYDGYDSSLSYGQTMEKWVPPAITSLPSREYLFFSFKKIFAIIDKCKYTLENKI